MVKVTAFASAALIALTAAAPAARPADEAQISRISGLPHFTNPIVPFPDATVSSRLHHHTPTPSPHRSHAPHHTPTPRVGGQRGHGINHLPSNILPRWLAPRASDGPQSDGNRGLKHSGKPMNPEFGQHHTPHSPHHTPTPTPGLHHGGQLGAHSHGLPSFTETGEGAMRTQLSPLPTESGRMHILPVPQQAGEGKGKSQ